ncbi:hypothetical protein SNE40_013377 [Patella caerulea]|uniref:C-type lectin domain-containing protein n=1 Tax=Patella caerulea TaxID=87958 RepID=A0AAN8JI50_PATCE
MVTTGIGSVSLNSIHVEEQLKETCLSTGYTPLLDGIFCVDMSTYKRTWPEARAVCNDTGGRLLIMTSVELSLKWEPIKDMTTNEFWIGGSDEAEEGTWVWLDGSGVTGSGWVPGQPDNYFGNEHCLQLKDC